MKKFLIIGVGMFLALSPLGAQTPADTVRLNLLMDSIVLNEVVVTERRTPAAAGRWSDMNPVELVTVAGANGDFYKALQTLPGTQLQGETGRLLVRGGSSEETQTYIDGLHVLVPYTSTIDGYKLACTNPILHVYVQRYQSGFGRCTVGVWAGSLCRPSLGDER